MRSTNTPYAAITGEGLGLSYSSKTQLGTLTPQQVLGQGKVKFYYNVSNGNLVLEDYLATFKDESGDINIGFIYNLQAKTPAEAWHFREHKRFLALPAKHDVDGLSPTVILEEQDGHLTTYQLDREQLTYFAPGHGDGIPFLLFDEEEDNWRLYHPGTHITERYDHRGWRLSCMDAAGRKTRYEYDQDHHVKVIIGHVGNRYELRREEQLLNVYAIFDSNEILITRYTFDSEQRLETTDIFTDLTKPYRIHYSYHTNTTCLNEITQTDGTKAIFTYANASHPNTLNGFRINENNCFVENANTNNGVAIFTDGSRLKTKFILDTRGRISQFVQGRSFPGDGRDSGEDITAYTYNDAGQIETITHPNGGVETFKYLDKQLKQSGLLSTHTQPNGQTTKFIYQPGSSFYRLICKQQYDQTDTKDKLVTRYVYDTDFDKQKKGHIFLCFQINPNGSVIEYRPTSKGDIASKRLYYQNIFDCSYLPPDLAPELASMQEWLGKQDAQQVMLTEYTYDYFGQVRETNIFANVDHQGEGVYDHTTGNIKSVKDMFGNELTREELQSYLQDKKIISKTSKSFDYLQRLTSAKDALNNITTIIYNDEAAQTKIIYPVNGANQLVEVKQRDAYGNVIKLIATGESSGVVVNRETTYKRDVDGWPVVVIKPNNQCHFTYQDCQQRIRFEVTPLGIVTEHRYDAAQRINVTILYDKAVSLKAIWPFSNAIPNVSMLYRALKKINAQPQSYEYVSTDVSNRPIYKVDANLFLTETRYDHLDRITITICYANPIDTSMLKALQAGKMLNLTLDVSKDRCTQYFYYANTKELVAEQDAAGYVTEYIRDAGGRHTQTIYYANKTKVVMTRHLKTIRPTASVEDAHITYMLDARGQRVQEVDAKGYMIARSFLACGLIEQERRYDHLLDVSWLIHRTDLPPKPISSSEDQMTHFHYDLLNREVECYQPFNHAVNLQYDNAGNLIFKKTYDLINPTNIDGSHTRATAACYDAWNQKVAEANPYVAQLLLNPLLTPKAREKIWQTQSTRYFYDESGLILYVVNSLGHKTYLYYDLDRRPVITIGPLGAVTETILDLAGHVVKQHVYAERVDSTMLAKLTGGFITTELRQYLDQTLKDDTHDMTTTYVRDVYGQATQITDAEGHISYITYNAFREQERVIIPIADYQHTMTTTHRYEPRGLIIETTKSCAELSVCEQFEYNNMFGLQTAYTDPEGNRSQTKYDQRGDITQQINAAELVIHNYTRDAFSRIHTDTDVLGKVTKHDYSQKERTHTVHFPVSGCKRITTANVFNEKAIVTDSVNNIKQWTYEPDGQIAIFTDALFQNTIKKYNLLGQHVLTIAANNIQTSFTYNEESYLRMEIQDAAQGGAQLKTIYITDVLGNKKEIDDPRQVKTIQIFNRCSQPTSIIIDPDKENLITNKNYNAQGVLISNTKSDPSKRLLYQEIHQQDGLNRPISQIVDPTGLAISHQQQLNKNGKVIATIDPNGAITRYFFNHFNLECFVVDAEGGVFEKQYDAANRLHIERIYEKQVDLNKMTAETTLSNLLHLVQIDPQDSFIYHFYDDNHHERFTVNSLGAVIEKRYDLAGRIIEYIAYAKPIDVASLAILTTDQLANEMAKEANHSDQDRHTYYILNVLGQQRFQINAKHFITEKRFDSMGSVIATIQYANAVNDPKTITQLPCDEVLAQINTHPKEDRAYYQVFNSLNQLWFTIDPIGAVVRFDRDENGNIVQETHFAAAIPAFTEYADLVAYVKNLLPGKNDRSVQRQYDGANRQIKEIDALGKEDYFQLDVLNNVVNHTDRAHSVWKNHFDAANRHDLEITPLVPVTTVTAKITHEIESVHNDWIVISAEAEPQIANDDVQLAAEKNLVALEKKITHDKAGNQITIIEASNTSEARTLHCVYNRCNKPTETYVEQVNIDDPSKIATWHSRPEATITTLSTKVVYNAKQLVVAEKDYADGWHFTTYDSESRKVYEVHPIDSKNFSVKKINYNTFGEEIAEINYATPITVEITQYEKIGIPLSILESIIAPNPEEDRTVTYKRDRCGKLIHAEQDKILSYSPSEAGSLNARLAAPQSEQRYNAFGELIDERVLLKEGDAAADNTWVKTLYWQNQQGRTIAKARAMNASGYAMQMQHFNVFRERVEKIEYAEMLPPAAVEDKDLEEIEKAITAIASSDRDRKISYQYDLCGNLITETFFNGYCSTLQWTPNNAPQKIDTRENVTRHHQYDNLQQEVATIYEDGSTDYFYFDARGVQIAYAAVSRDNGAGQILIPYTEYGIGPCRDRVQTLRYEGGTAHADVGVLPIPINHSEAKNLIELTMFDQLGRVIWKQDAEGYVTGYTYTANKQRAREWWHLTNNDAVHIDEKRWCYNKGNRVIAASLLRDNTLDQMTAVKYNTFLEPIAEGPGDGTYPLYRKFDQLGNVWSTNEGDGVSTILLYDLLRRGTVQMRSPSLDPSHYLENITYHQLPSILSWPIEQLEKTENVRDDAGRVISRRMPAFNEVPNHSVGDLPLSIVSGHAYPAFGETSLTWVMPQERDLIMKFSLSPLVKPEQVMQIPHIVIKNNRCGIDVSQLPTDTYVFTINYYLRLNPVLYPDTSETGALVYQTKGSLQIDSGLVKDSLSMVVVIEKDYLARLTGNIQDVLEVDLCQDDKVIATLPVKNPNTETAHVDLSAYPSGEYTLKPEPSKTASLPFTIYTKTLSNKPIAQEISAQIKIELIGKEGCVLWQVPSTFASQPILIICNYLKEDDEPGLFTSDILKPITKDGWNTAAITLETPVKKISSMTVKLQLNQDEWIPLAIGLIALPPVTKPLVTNAIPVAKEKGKEKEIQKYDEGWVVIEEKRASPCAMNNDLDDWEILDGHSHTLTQTLALVSKETETIHFPPCDIVYITPLTGYTTHSTIHYLDMTKDRQAEWYTVPVIATTTKGIILDVRGLPPCVYPYRTDKKLFKSRLHDFILKGKIDGKETDFNFVEEMIAAHPDTGFQLFGASRQEVVNAIQKHHHRVDFAKLLEVHTWLDYHTALLYAKIINKNLFVWERGAEPHTVILVAKHDTGNGEEPVHICHFSLSTRFTVLQRQEVYQAKQELFDTFTVCHGSMVYASTKPNTVAHAVSQQTPAYHYTYDVWGNILSETNTLGKTTEYTYSNRNNKLTRLQPETTIVGEDGKNIRQRPLTIWGYNKRGIQVTERDANHHDSGRVVNANGQLVHQVDGTGISMLNRQYDALDRLKKYTDGAGRSWELFYEYSHHPVMIRAPSGNITAYTYNERGLRRTEMNPDDYVRNIRTMLDYNASGEIICHTLPRGQKIWKEYQRHKLVREKNLDGILTWTYDYFGSLLNHIDLSDKEPQLNGAVYQYTYDRKRQVITQQVVQNASKHGLQLRAHSILNGGMLYRGMYTEATPAQFLVFKYRIGKLIQVADVANARLTEYLLNTEDVRIGTILRGAIDRNHNYSGVIISQRTTGLDELGRESVNTDGGMTLYTNHDAAGNRRVTSGVLTFTDGEVMPGAQRWHKFDKANRMLIDGGTLGSDQQITALNQGTELAYNIAGMLDHQIYHDESGGRHTASIAYDSDGLAHHVVTDGIEEIFGLDGEGRRITYLKKQGSQTKEIENTHYDENGWLYKNESVRNGNSVTTNYSLVGAGHISSQNTNINGSIIDASVYHLLSFETIKLSQTVVTRTVAGRHQGGGHSWEYHDANGFITAQISIDNGNGGRKSVFYDWTYDGVMLRKYELVQVHDENGHDVDAYQVTKTTNHFHTNDGNYIGSYEFEYERYNQIKNLFANYNFGFLISRSSFMRGMVAGVRDIAGRRQLSGITHQQVGALGGGIQSLEKNKFHFFGKFKLDDLVAAVGKSFPPAVPAFCEVQQGDTYQSIAKRLNQSENYALLLSTANGDKPLIAGESIRTPEFHSFTNQAGEYRSYEEFISTMVETLRPFIAMPKEEEDDSFLGTLVAVIVVAAAAVFSGGTLGPIVAGAILGMEAGVAASTVAGTAIIAATTAVSATLANAGEQEFAVKAGWQNHFSLSTAIENGAITGLTAGMGAYFSGFASAGNALEQLGIQMAEAGAIDVADQLVQMKLSNRKFNLAQVGAAMLGRAINVKATTSMGLPVNEPSSTFVENTTATVVQGALNTQFNHVPFDFKMVAVQAIGSTIGNQAGEAAGAQFKAKFTKKYDPRLYAASHKLSEHTNNTLTARNQTGNTAASGYYGKSIKPLPRMFSFDDDKLRSTQFNQITHHEPTATEILNAKANIAAIRSNNTVMNDVTDATLEMLSMLLDRTHVGSAIEMARDMRQDTRILMYSNDSYERLLAGGKLAAEVFGGRVLGKLSDVRLPTTVRELSRFTLFAKGTKVAENTVNFSAQNHINGLRLQRQLMIEQASSIFTKEGYLTEDTIKNSARIPLSEIKNLKLLNELSTFPGSLSDWAKYTTESIPSPSGSFQMHFYHNKVTGDVYYGRDYKAVFDHQGMKNISPKPNFDYETPKLN